MRPEKAAQRAQKKQSVASPLITGQLSMSDLTWHPAPMALEPRMMFDGAMLATADVIDDELLFDDNAPKTNPDVPAVSAPGNVDTQRIRIQKTTALDVADSDALSFEAASSEGEKVVIVSGYLPNIPILVNSLSSRTNVHVLEGHGDAIGEISEILSGYSQISELHIVTHGRNGALVVGEEVIDHERLTSEVASLSGWQDALTSGADILLYGCDIGANESGRIFVEALAAKTGADIAASDDATAPNSLDGNAELEVHVGKVTAAPILTADLLD